MPVDEQGDDDSDCLPDHMFSHSIQEDVLMVNALATREQNAPSTLPISPERIAQEQDAEPTFRVILQECTANGGKHPANMFLVENNLLYMIRKREKLLMIPFSLRGEVLRHYHENNAHLARDRLYLLLKTRFHWPGMYSCVRDYVRSCTCQLVKTPQPVRNGLLQPIESSRPGQTWVVDIVGPVWSSKAGNKYVLVAIDNFTNWVVAGTMKNMTAEEVVRLFFELVIKDHACPENIISDQGTQFKSNAFRALCTAYGINKLDASAYHHQTAGKVERFIRFLKNALAASTPRDNLQSWDEHIGHCLFAYRISVSRVLGDTPFFTLYGRDPVLPQDLVFHTKQTGRRVDTNDAAEEGSYQYRLSKRMKLAHDNLLKRKREEQVKYKLYYDSSHKPVEFKIGAQALILFDAPAKGFLVPRWEGPFSITERLGPVSYRVENDSRTFVAHVQRMAPYFDRAAMKSLPAAALSSR
jgi:transposase InsO family protein